MEMAWCGALAFLLLPAFTCSCAAVFFVVILLPFVYFPGTGVELSTSHVYRYETSSRSEANVQYKQKAPRKMAK